MIDKLSKEFPRAFVISNLVFIVLLLIKFVTGTVIEFNYSLLEFYSYTNLYSLSLYFANASLFIFLDDKFANDRFSLKRIIWGFILSLIISIAIIFLLRIIEDVLIEGKSWSIFISNENSYNYFVSFFMTFIVTLLFHVFYIYKSFQ